MLNSRKTTIYQCNIIHFPKIESRSGNITPIENDINIPFKIKRVYYLYDVPGGESRGGHAHKKLHQVMVAASGSFDVLLNDGINKKVANLNRPYMGLHVVPGHWRKIVNFSSGAICLVLASELYDEQDYIRQYSEFLEFKKDDR